MEEARTMINGGNLDMKMLNEVNPAQAYFEGMLWAAFGVRIFSDNVAEWQIDAVKKYAKKLKDEEILHSEIAPSEKKNQKKVWEEWMDETTKGFKEVLKREGRMK
jgi:hypothetical protein